MAQYDMMWYDITSIDLQPDTKVYNAAIHAWSRYRRTIKSKSLFSGKINSFQQGVLLLNKMKQLDQHQQPDKISYSSVIHSLANHGIVEEVESLLHEMEEWSRHNCSSMNVDMFMRPDRVTYKLVIRAWAKNQNPKRRIAWCFESRCHCIQLHSSCVGQLQ